MHLTMGDIDLDDLGQGRGDGDGGSLGCVGEDRTAIDGFSVGVRSLWNVMAYAASI